MVRKQDEVLERLYILQKNADILRFLHLQGRGRALKLLCDMHELQAKIVFGFLLHVALNLNGKLLSSFMGQALGEHESITLFRFTRSIVRSIAKKPPKRFERLIPRTIP